MLATFDDTICLRCGEGHLRFFDAGDRQAYRCDACPNWGFETPAGAMSEPL